MANTVIQLKYSTVTSTPTSLNVAEPAYSYTSNTLFIGSPAGTGAIAIGGKFYLDQQQDIYNLTNAAFSAANSAGSSAFAQGAYNHANSGFHQANAAYALANTNSGNITAIQGVNLTQNTNITTAQNAADNGFHQANAAYVQANTNASNITALQGVNLTQNTNITNAQNTADAAYIRANNSLNANTGGSVTGTVSITGDLDVTGNLVISGTTVTQNVTTLNIADPLIYLAANNYVSDIVDIGFIGNYYDGASQRHAGVIRKHGTDNFYIFTNYEHEPANNIVDTSDASFRKGTLYANLVADIATIGGVDIKQYTTNAFYQANAAYGQANSATNSASSGFHQANAAYGQANSATNSAVSAFHQANASYAQANTNAGDITVLQGVNLTQNTNITNAQNSADAAFTHANGAFNKANTDYTEISISAADYGSATRVASFKVEANGRISSANSTLIAIDASQITSGTLGVTRGGTGNTSLQLNAVLLGQGTSAVTAVGSSVEGHVLTINSSGVPTFEHISGGTF